MKRFCLATTLSASVVMLVGCSQSFNTTFSSRAETVSMQVTSPQESLRMARKLAWEAAVLVQHPPHVADRWQEARVKWRQAIRLLESIPDDSALALEGQRKLKDYRIKYAAITGRLTQETQATEKFEEAQTMAWQAAVTVQNPPHKTYTWQRAVERWERAVQLLSEIPSFTTVSATARTKVVTYRQNQRTIAQQLAAEKTFLATLNTFSSTVAQLNMLQSRALNGQTQDPIGMDYDEYQTFVRSLQELQKQLEPLPISKANPAYAEMKAAIADYKFALTIWQTYQRHKQANAEWLQNGDFFNRLVPLSLIDGDRLLQRYDIKISQGLSEAKVPLQPTIWAIWEKANSHVQLAQQKAASFR